MMKTFSVSMAQPESEDRSFLTHECPLYLVSLVTNNKVVTYRCILVIFVR